MHANRPSAGQVQRLEDGVQCVLAPNPSPMTHWGTNTYLIGGHGGLAVIDPGPDDPAHLAALLAAIGPHPVSHIIVTHSHLDHSALARPLARATGAPVLGFGPATAGRSKAMQALVAGGLSSGGEGIDTEFSPDIVLSDGAVLEGAEWTLEVIHTPGHIGNHICLDLDGSLFSGDHIMGWASSLVSPPDGDLTDFMASCRKLAERRLLRCYPGHGAPVGDPASRLRWLMGHRLGRESQIVAALESHAESLTLDRLTARIYHDVPAHLHPAARRNVLAHLVDLIGRNMVTATAPVTENSRFSRTPDTRR